MGASLDFTIFVCVCYFQDGGVSEMEAEMEASLKQQQAKRRAAAGKRNASNKRQKQVCQK